MLREYSMIGIAILGVFLLAAIILLASNSKRMGIRKSAKAKGPTLLYSHDSRDKVAEVYYPAIRDSTALFPLSKKEEREKTETFQSRS
jgi:hypothetical protein